MESSLSFSKTFSLTSSTGLQNSPFEIGNSGIIPKLWIESKVIVILKPNKDASEPYNYRPIYLLSTMYKLFERLLLARLQPIVEKSLPIEQDRFRKNRNYCNQDLAITTHVEIGFQWKAKSGAVFLIYRQLMT